MHREDPAAPAAPAEEGVVVEEAAVEAALPLGTAFGSEEKMKINEDGYPPSILFFLFGLTEFLTCSACGNRRCRCRRSKDHGLEQLLCQIGLLFVLRVDIFHHQVKSVRADAGKVGS